MVANTTPEQAYAGGHFELRIDGKTTTTYLKSVDGGFVTASPIDEAIGGINQHIKHQSVVEIEPIMLELGMAGASDVFKWIQASWLRQFARHSGQITHGDFDLNQRFTHEFFNALIVETTVPALDATSKDGLYCKVKIQPERVVTKPQKGPRLTLAPSKKQKNWAPSNFRFNIDGLTCMRLVNKLDSFTIKQGIKKLYTGEQRFPEIEPTKIEFPNLSGTIALGHAKELFDWYDSYLVKGQNDLKAQKTGSLQFLAPNGAMLFEIVMAEIGLFKLKIEPSTANADSLKLVRFEMYVGKMELGAGPGFG